jgi:hypothetical protein
MSKSAGGPEAPETDTAVLDLLAQSMRAQRDDLVSKAQQCSSNGQEWIEVPGTGGGDDESFHGSCHSKAHGVKHYWPLARRCWSSTKCAVPRSRDGQ